MRGGLDEVDGLKPKGAAGGGGVAAVAAKGLAGGWLLGRGMDKVMVMPAEVLCGLERAARAGEAVKRTGKGGGNGRPLARSAWGEGGEG